MCERITALEVARVERHTKAVAESTSSGQQGMIAEKYEKKEITSNKTNCFGLLTNS